MSPPGPISTLTLAAHAKLNLALSVGLALGSGPAHGFHPIASWIAPIELHDTLELVRLPEGAESRFSTLWESDAPRPSPVDWPVRSDLIFRAHSLAQERAARPLPVSARLRKRIPVGGGLGGGSSDAAAALKGLNRLFDLALSSDELRALGARLGSDVAFFIDDMDDPVPRGAIVTGLGETVERLLRPLRDEVVLIIPPFGCPTAAVYMAFDRQPLARLDEGRVRTLASAGALDPAALFNDLAAPAGEAEPRLRQAMDQLRAALGPRDLVHVTGSGSTLFVLPGPGRSSAVESLIETACPGVVARRTQLL